jgi:hypothetical protein
MIPTNWTDLRRIKENCDRKFQPLFIVQKENVLIFYCLDQTAALFNFFRSTYLLMPAFREFIFVCNEEDMTSLKSLRTILVINKNNKPSTISKCLTCFKVTKRWITAKKTYSKIVLLIILLSLVGLSMYLIFGFRLGSLKLV